MPSALETAIAAFRERLLENDRETLTAIGEAYAEVRGRLLERVEALVADLAERGTLTSAELARWDRAQALLRQAEAEMTLLAARVEPVVAAGQETVVGMASRQAQALAAIAAIEGGAGAVGARITASWNRLNAGAVEAIVGRLSDGSPLRAWTETFGASAGERMRRELVAAVATGENPRSVARRLTRSLDADGARMLTFARTAQLGAFRDASRQSMIANDDILDGYMRVAALQPRTCAVCLALSGTVYPTNEVMPVHPNDRCTMVPIVKGVPRPALQTGAAWFDAQPAATQRQIVGIAGHAAYRRGEIVLGDLVKRYDDPRWGPTVQVASLGEARANAARRTRRAA